MTREKALKDYLYSFLSENRKEQFERILVNRTRHFGVALENIFQPHNANAVIRSCDCFGIQDVHIIAEYNDFLASKNVSKGALKWTSQYKYASIAEGLSSMRDQGYQIVATTPHTDGNTIYDFDIDKKSIFFFGAEKNGLSDVVLEQADTFLKIPMVGQTESLNISVSAAIIMQQLTHQLRQSDIPWQLTAEEKENLRLNWAEKSVSRIDVVIREFDKLYPQYL